MAKPAASVFRSFPPVAARRAGGSCWCYMGKIRESVSEQVQLLLMVRVGKLK